MDNVAQETVDTAVMDDAALRQMISDTDKADSAKTDGDAAREAATQKQEGNADASQGEKITIDKAEYEKLSKQVQEKENFIQRQANEIGNLRKFTREKKEALEKELQDPVLAVENTRAYIDKSLEARDLGKQEQDYAKQEAELVNKQFLKTAVPDLESLIDDIAKIAADDYKKAGHDDAAIDKVISAFKANPYSANAEIVHALAQRAIINRRLNAAQEEIAALKKKPEEVVKKIENAFKSSPSLTASSGQGTASKASVSEDQISLMSDAELAEFIKNSD